MQTVEVDYSHYDDVDSTVIEAVWYDVVTNKLYIEFLSGSVFAYENISKLHFDGLVNKFNSSGAYYNDFIKGKYTSQFLGYNYAVHFNYVPQVVATVAPTKLFTVYCVVEATDLSDAISQATAGNIEYVTGVKQIG